MPGDIARQWFIPGDGIERQVISADIQRYLGNDATVRPGVGTGENQGVQGYWIKAYRNLTSAMIADLRADSGRWRQEQRQTGSRDPYIGSRTYEEGSASRAHRRDGNSPALDGPYGAPIPGSRGPTERSRGVPDPMQVDQSGSASSRYPQPGGQPPSRGYQDPRGYPPENSRDYSRQQQSSRPYQSDQVMSDAYAPPVTASYGQDPRYAPAYGQPGDGAPPGYVRQGDYFVPVSQAGFSNPSAIAGIAGGRTEPQQYAPGYGQPQAPQYRDGRDPRDARDPRYGGQPEYTDPRNAYPSPAATVSSVTARDREPLTSPPQPSPFGTAPPQYEYGQPAPQPRTGYSQPEPGYAPPSRDSGYGRERPSGGSGPSHSDRERRRRH